MRVLIFFSISDAWCGNSAFLLSLYLCLCWVFRVGPCDSVHFKGWATSGAIADTRWVCADLPGPSSVLGLAQIPV